MSINTVLSIVSLNNYWLKEAAKKSSYFSGPAIFPISHMAKRVLMIFVRYEEGINTTVPNYIDGNSEKGAHIRSNLCY